MKIEDDGYRIIAWLDRNPQKTSVKEWIMKALGFEYVEEVWQLHLIPSPEEAKKKFSDITYKLDQNMESS